MKHPWTNGDCQVFCPVNVFWTFSRFEPTTIRTFSDPPTIVLHSTQPLMLRLNIDHAVRIVVALNSQSTQKQLFLPSNTQKVQIELTNVASSTFLQFKNDSSTNKTFAQTVSYRYLVHKHVKELRSVTQSYFLKTSELQT